MSGVASAVGVAGAALRTGLAAGGVAAAAGIGFAINKSVNFEQSMANVQARLGTTKGNMQLLSDQALDLGAKTQFSAQQAADAMGVLAQQGFNTQQIMGMMPGTLSLAAASGADLAQAADIQTEALHGFGLSAGQAGRVADVLAQTSNKSAAGIDDMQESIKYIAPVAKASGQSMEDMMAAVGILANVGIKGSQAGTTLRTSLVRLANPTDKARGALGELGLKAGDLVGKKGLLSMPNIMGKVVKGAQGVSKNTRNAALATIFGREALSGMVALVEKGPKKFKAMSDALENSKGAAKRTADIMRNTVKGSWDNFTGSIETAAIRLTKRFNPAMKGALNWAATKVNVGTGTLAGFISGVTGEAAAKRAAGPKPGARLGQAGNRDVAPPKPKGAEGFGEKVRGVLGSIGDAMVKLGPKLADVGKQVVDAFAPAMPFLQNVLLPLLKGIAMGVVGAFLAALPAVKMLMTALGWVGKAAAPLKPVFQGIGMVIGFVLGGPILRALGLIPKVGLVFRLLAVPIRVATSGFRLVAGVVGRVIGAFPRAVTAVQRFAATFSGIGRKVVLTATNFVQGIIGRISSLVGKIRGLGGRLLSAGKGIMGKLFSGIRAGFSAAGGAMAGLGRMLADWLNAHTPLGDKVSAGPIHFTLPSLATGGVVRRGGAAIVGERGPELVRLPARARVYDSEQTTRARAAMAPSPGATFVANLHLDGRQIHQAVFRHDQRLAEAT